MPDAFASSLIGKTDPSPYGQAIFLSQSMINKSFHNMWALTPKGDPSPLREFKYESLLGTMNITLNAPTVKLMTTKRDPQLIFMLNIKSGMITINTGKSLSDLQPKDFDATNWTFAFAVKLARKTVPKTDAKYTAAVTSAGFSPEVYSLAQLYLDVSSSTHTCTEYNKYGNYNWKEQSTDTRSTYDTFCTKWLTSMMQNECNVVGYSLHATKPDPAKVDAATFPPTSIDYWVYPWKDPELSNPPVIDDSPNNALSYLMMSDFETPPERIGLKYSGTFIKDGGLYIMNRDKFWRLWLIPLMQGLNKGAEIIPDGPLATYTSGRDWPWDTEPRYLVGVDRSHKTTDPYYNFTKDSSQAATWTWCGEKRSSSKTASNGNRRMVCSQTSITSTKLFFDQGGQGVTLQGKTDFTFTCQFGWKQLNTGKPSETKITNEWTFKMGLIKVNDGGVELAFVSRNVNDPVVESSTGKVIWKGGIDTVTKGFSIGLKEYIHNDTDEIENALLSSLKSHDKLLLPGSGTFLMKDPMFNNRGDLLVKLSYNGADPPDPPSTTTSTKSSASTTAKASMAQKMGITGPVVFDVRGLPSRRTPHPARKLGIRSKAGTLLVSAA